jgi:hypothetical protein
MTEQLSTYTVSTLTGAAEVPEVLGAFTVNADVKEDEFNFTTIQAAVNAIPAGSVLYITTGVYTEDVTWNKKLSVIGLGGDNFHFKTTAELTPDITISGENTISAAVRFYGIYFKRNTVGQVTIKFSTWPLTESGDTATYFTRCGIYTESDADYAITNTVDYGSSAEFGRELHLYDCQFIEAVTRSLAISVSKNNQVVCDNTEGFGLITMADRAVLTCTSKSWSGQIDGTALRLGSKGRPFIGNPEIGSTTISTISDAHNAFLLVGDELAGSGIVPHTKIVTLNNEGGDNNSIIIDTPALESFIDASIPLRSIPLNNTETSITATTTNGNAILTGISNLDHVLLTVGDVMTGTGVYLGSRITAVGNEGGDANTVTLDTAAVASGTVAVTPTAARKSVNLFRMTLTNTDVTNALIRLNDDNWLTAYNCEFNQVSLLAQNSVIEINSSNTSNKGRLLYDSLRFSGINIVKIHMGSTSIASLASTFNESM